MEIINIEETASTNSYLSRIAAESAHGTVVSAYRQTAGRGQRGNSWESEPGKNLTFSILLKGTGVAPSGQFSLSEACALGVARTLRRYIGQASVKWSNDIYYGDSKICGMLIEHSLSGGKIDHTIAGIGINVNQTVFRSDAPNPISMAMVAGHEFDTGEVLESVCQEILRLCASLPSASASLHKEFLGSLYRRDGIYPYRSAICSVSVDGKETIPAGAEFEAAILDVAPDGILSLQTTSGSIHRFAFKEVSFIIK